VKNPDDIAAVLRGLGLSSYEAKSYMALLALGSGNGYAVAKHAGIPTAKVYEALSALLAKGFAISDGMKTPLHRPVAPEKALGKIKRGVAEKIEMLMPELKNIAARTNDFDVLSIKDAKPVYDAVRKLLKNADGKILITAWPVELDLFRTELGEMAENMEVYILSNGKYKLDGANVFTHRRADLVGSFFPERWMLAVSSKEGIAATFDKNGDAQCVWTERPGIFRIFADHILHDISLNIVLSKLPEAVRGSMEEELIELRDKLRV